MIDTCIKAQLPEPELTERDGGFLVTLFSVNVGKDVGKDVGKSVGKDVLETLNLIEKDPKYTTEQIAKITGKES